MLVVPDILHSFVDVLPQSTSCPPLGLALDDGKDAYRQLPVNTPQYTLVAVWNFATSNVSFYQIYGHNFGFSSAVANYSRLSTFLSSFANFSVVVMCFNYLDDFPQVDILACHGSGQSAFTWTVNRFFGQPTKAAKQQQTAVAHQCLGILVDVSTFHTTGAVTLSTIPVRAAAYLRTLANAMVANHLPSTLARTICGQLQFVFRATAALVGRPAMVWAALWWGATSC